jgi:predicted nucleic acid-binding protein
VGVYVDASVLLRIVLRQPGALAWPVGGGRRPEHSTGGGGLRPPTGGGRRPEHSTGGGLGPGRARKAEHSPGAPISSALIEVECLRVLDRLARVGQLARRQAAERAARVHDFLSSFDLVDLDRTILRRAAQPFGVVLGTLDALHLATALVLHEARGELVLATHDEQLALAARAQGLGVIGA